MASGPRRDGVGVATPGDSVRVRRPGTGDWVTGTVTEICPDGRPLVRVEGVPGRGHVFDDVEVVRRAGQGTPGSGPAARPRSAMREKLQAYYGLSKDNELNIDSQHFNPDLYARKLLREKKLTGEGGLLQKDREIEREVDRLDHELQMLVYDNYRNFIGATKLIGEMRDKVSSMEGEMGRLSDNMARITALSDDVRGRLSGSRDEIDRLVGINRTLQKIQFLVDLPEKLDELCKRNAFDRAVRYWVTGSEILERYSHVRSFEQVHKGCAEVVARLLSRLKEGLKTPLTEANAPRVRSCVRLLRKLVQRRDEAEREELEAECRQLIFTGVDAEVESRCAAAIDAVQGAAQRRVARSLPFPEVGGPEWGIDQHFEALRDATALLQRALQCLARSAEQVGDETKVALQPRFKAVMQQGADNVLAAALARFRAGPPTGAHVAASTAAFVEDMRALSTSVAELLRQFHQKGTRDTTHAAWELAAQSHYGVLVSLLDHMQREAVDATGVVLESGRCPQRGRELLVMAAAAQAIAGEALPQLHVHLRRAFDREVDTADRPGGLPEGYRAAARSLAAAVVETAGQLLGRTAQTWAPRESPTDCTATADRLCAEVSAAVQDVHAVLPRHEEPSGQRDAGSASRYSRASRDSRDGAGSATGALSVPPALRSCGPGKVELSQEMDRMFAPRLSVRPAKATAQAVAEAIVAHATKSLSETVRMRALDTGGLQQLQVDAHSMRQRLAMFTRGKGFNECVDDVIRSGYDRTAHPEFLSEEAAADAVQRAPSTHLVVCGGAVAAALVCAREERF